MTFRVALLDGTKPRIKRRGVKLDLLNIAAFQGFELWGHGVPVDEIAVVAVGARYISNPPTYGVKLGERLHAWLKEFSPDFVISSQLCRTSLKAYPVLVLQREVDAVAFSLARGKFKIASVGDYLAQLDERVQHMEQHIEMISAEGVQTINPDTMMPFDSPRDFSGFLKRAKESLATQKAEAALIRDGGMWF